MLGLTHDNLRACLAATPPVELLGMALLKQGSPQFVPGAIPREKLRDAVTELVAYTESCKAAAYQLRHLAPVPLVSVAILEFGI
ncbi:MAG: hypothetical protein K8S97_14445 [Anaerolineae bacterium]|nr:hypothetical protein [Anaerolineae bacterium]